MEQQQGGEYLAPGVWIDREGALHFSVPDILEHLGLPNTDAGRESARRGIFAALREQCSDMTVIVQDDHSPTREDRAPAPKRMRLRYKSFGGHVHGRLFSADGAKHGDVTFDEREWPAIRAALEHVMDVLPEDTTDV